MGSQAAYRQLQMPLDRAEEHSLEVEWVGDGHLGVVAELASEHSYWPSRGYRSYGHDLGAHDAAFAMERFGAALAGGQATVGCVVTDQAELAGAVSATQSSFDTEHFEIPMWEVDSVLTREDGRRRSEVVATLASGLLERIPGMATARVDAADVHALHGFQEAGFRVLNTLMTYVSEHGRELPQAPGDAPDVRVFERGQPPDLTEAQKDRLCAEAPSLFTASRFDGDPRIPADKARSLQEKRTRNIVEGEWADWIFMTFEAGEPGLLLAFRYLDGFGPDDSPSILGQALGFVSQKRGAGVSSAAFSPLLAAMPCDFLEYQAQARVAPLLKLLPRAATFLRSTYVLQGWSATPG